MRGATKRADWCLERHDGRHAPAAHRALSPPFGPDGVRSPPYRHGISVRRRLHAPRSMGQYASTSPDIPGAGPAMTPMSYSGLPGAWFGAATTA